MFSWDPEMSTASIDAESQRMTYAPASSEGTKSCAISREPMEPNTGRYEFRVLIDSPGNHNLAVGVAKKECSEGKLKMKRHFNESPNSRMTFAWYSGGSYYHNATPKKSSFGRLDRGDVACFMVDTDKHELWACKTSSVDDVVTEDTYELALQLDPEPLFVYCELQTKEERATLLSDGLPPK